MPDLILQVGRFLFEQPPDQQIPLQQLYLALPDHDQVTIGDVLHRMHMQHLIEATFQNDPIRLSRDGREAWNDESIMELTLGMAAEQTVDVAPQFAETKPSDPV